LVDAVDQEEVLLEDLDDKVLPDELKGKTSA